MATRIELRTDTEANWQSVNPVLSLGEVGIAIDQNAIKLGDGATAWNDLEYISGGGGGGPVGPVLEDINRVQSEDGEPLELGSHNDTSITIQPNGATEVNLLMASTRDIEFIDAGVISDGINLDFEFSDVVRFQIQGDQGFGQATGLVDGRSGWIIVDRGEGTSPGDVIVDRSQDDPNTNFIISDPDDILGLQQRYAYIHWFAWQGNLVGTVVGQSD